MDMDSETRGRAWVHSERVRDSPEDAGGAPGESSAQFVFAAEESQDQHHHQLRGKSFAHFIAHRRLPGRLHAITHQREKIKDGLWDISTRVVSAVCVSVK